MKKPKLRYRSAKKPVLGTKSKAALREELAAETSRFLNAGGEVHEVPSGTSAWEPGAKPPPSSQPIFSEPKQSRTPVPDVVARLEARREAMKSRSKSASKASSKSSKQKLIYDDFGEPLRKVWIDE
ncbi:MAG: hypothetical protein AAF098_08215 [Pseudomonadota bacterium]